MITTRNGNILTVGVKHLDAFYDYIQICDHGISCEFCCWEWQGARNNNGYGRFRVTNGVAGAHVLAYAIAHGRIIYTPAQVLHTCDNPPCCQVHHLFVGSQGDNMHDMWEKKRHPGAWPPERHEKRLKQILARIPR